MRFKPALFSKWISIIIAAGFALVACTSSSVPPQESSDMSQSDERQTSAADPKKLLTSPAGAIVMQARISAILREKNGCLVIGSTDDQTVVWPAGTTLSADRRAVVVGGSGKIVPIGTRFVASGGQVPLESPPSGLQAIAIGQGCPGALAAVGGVQ